MTPTLQLALLLSYLGLALFLTGFFLTRRELPIKAVGNVSGIGRDVVDVEDAHRVCRVC
jgi:hypothetical protein